MRNAFFIFFILFIFSGPVFAATTGYQPLAPIPGLTTVATGGDATKSGQGLAQYLRNLYTFGIGAAVALAIIVVMWGGIEYIISVSGDGKSGGKERIQSAILGLLLALGSYIILKTINKDLLNLNFSLEPLVVEKAPVVPPEIQEILKNAAATSNGRFVTQDSNGFITNSQGQKTLDSNNNPIRLAPGTDLSNLMINSSNGMIIDRRTGQLILDADAEAVQVQRNGTSGTATW